jgi:hypothetical protein
MKINEVTVSVGTVSTLVIGVSVNRYALIIAAPSQFRVSLAFKKPAVLDQCITLYPGDPPLKICRDEFGDVFDYDMHAIAPNAQQLNLIEVLL